MDEQKFLDFIGKISVMKPASIDDDNEKHTVHWGSNSN